MMVNLKKTEQMVMVHIIIKMVLNTLVLGEMILKTVSGERNGKTALTMKVLSNKVVNMAKAYINGQMEVYTMEFG
jgi:hypothetical protein